MLLHSTVPALLALLSSIPLATSTAAGQPLANGLTIETTVPVACTRKSQPGDVLYMRYRGVLQENGKKFDGNFDSSSPFKFQLGAGQVIKGWDAGLVNMCIGEGRRLTIPAQMGYGARGAGPDIPPNAVLIFDTELEGIDGVKETAPVVQPPPAPIPVPVPVDTTPANTVPAGSTPVGTVGSPDGSISADGSVVGASGSEKGPADEEGSGECKLLGDFAILVQGALGLLALLSLVLKRWREKPRRPLLIWFFDVSKQVTGSFLLHFANLFLAMLSSGGLDIKSTELGVQDGKGQSPNPCSFYLLNLAIDTTIGIPILVFFLRILHALFLRTPLANPPESLKSGNYGNPPSWRWWLKQALIYFLGLFGMKFTVFLLFQLFPWLGWVGDWALRWTEGREWVQITFVMLIFPLVMNAAQYWIIDSFIKDTSASTGGDDQGTYRSVGTRDNDGGADDDDDDDDDNGGVRETQGLISGARSGRHSSSRDDAVGRTKDANPLPLPIEFESEDEDGGNARKTR